MGGDFGTSLTLLDRTDERSKILGNKFNQGGVRHTKKKSCAHGLEDSTVEIAIL